jgi:ribosomal protein L11 methyltransferase
MLYPIAPRIVLYPFGSTPPAAEQSSLALAQLPQRSDSIVFGDGSHPTTRLCAGVVDALCRERHPEAVLDVGTGTGILARIARARGARLVMGTDSDPAALAVAKAHCDLDSHGTEINLSANPPDCWGARFDLVVANILEEPLRYLAPALARALRPGGVLLLSGFTRLQIPALRLLYENEQLRFITQSHLDEWALLMFERGLR